MKSSSRDRISACGAGILEATHNKNVEKSCAPGPRVRCANRCTRVASRPPSTAETCSIKGSSLRSRSSALSRCRGIRSPPSPSAYPGPCTFSGAEGRNAARIDGRRGGGGRRCQDPCGLLMVRRREHGVALCTSSPGPRRAPSAHRDLQVEGGASRFLRAFFFSLRILSFFTPPSSLKSRVPGWTLVHAHPPPTRPPSSSPPTRTSWEDAHEVREAERSTGNSSYRRNRVGGG